jgi:glycogen debranching enzyme
VVGVSIVFDIEADFADIFEVRGVRRHARGVLLEPEIDHQQLRLRYRGLDGLERSTAFRWDDRPAAVSSQLVRFEYELLPQQTVPLSFEIRCERQGVRIAPRQYDQAFEEASDALSAARRHYCLIESSSERFNQWVRRSAADIRMLVSPTADGDYPYAGVPWFSTPFGRDGIITALQLLWVNPRIAHGVLTYLAATQADDLNPDQDAEPGKILHETRSSEMARLGEVPFGRYYGSVDSTPLFVLLAAEYFARTGDRAFAAAMWPHVERALDWIDRYGDRDGDGFVEYARRSPTGLVQQGWKDSQDSVFHADGTLAEAPIAICEVQAYVYAARCGAAAIADALGYPDRADRLRRQAEELRAAFEEQFWCEEAGTYALALDGRKRRCAVRTSNAGHALFGGIASPERAGRVAEMLVGPPMFSGWGIRTVAASERRYNPMSYHNGSIWPHDNGLAAAGFSRYGFDTPLETTLTALFDAATTMDRFRLPELFCGFHRRDGEGPTLYPVACSPQAWASGVVFQLVQACTRLSIDATAGMLRLHRPTLPQFLDHLTFSNLELPFGSVDLRLERRALSVNATVLRQSKDFRIQITK